MTKLEKIKWDLLKARHLLKGLCDGALMDSNNLDPDYLDVHRSYSRGYYEGYHFSIEQIDNVLWNNYMLTQHESDKLSTVFDLGVAQIEWIKENAL